MRKWIARHDWPFELQPPWELRKVQAWREINVGLDPARAYRKKVAAVKAGTGELKPVLPKLAVR